MNIDIEKVEKYILYGANEGEIRNIHYNHTKGKIRSFGVWLCIFAVVAFVSAVLFLPRIENIILYFFLLIVPIILTTVICSIKHCAKAIDTVYEDIEKAEKRGRFIRILVWIPLFPAGLAAQNAFFYRHQLSNAALTFWVIIFVACTVLFVYAACVRFYKIHLMKKYAPYFKDERLRPFVPPAASEAVDVAVSDESSEPE